VTSTWCCTMVGVLIVAVRVVLPVVGRAGGGRGSADVGSPLPGCMQYIFLAVGFLELKKVCGF